MSRSVALISDSALLDEVLRISAAIENEIERVPDTAALRVRWREATTVLLDISAVVEIASLGFPRRARVVAVSAGPPDPLVWQHGVVVGIERVIDVVRQPRELSALLDDALAEGCEKGRVLAVVGGRGGAGASVFAVGLAHTVVAQGRRSLLVDCDPLGGGLDLTVGLEKQQGMRWPQLRHTGGRIPTSSLYGALPQKTGGRGSLTLLSCDREGAQLEPDGVAAVIDAGRRGGNIVICDVPRQLTDAAAVAIDRADLAIVVVPAEVRACASARNVARQIAHRGIPIHAVVRGPAPGGLSGEQVAEVVGVPLLAAMRPEPRLAVALDHGRFPTGVRGPLARAAREVLAVLDA